MEVSCELFAAQSLGVRRARFEIDDAWLEVSYGTGSAHGASLGRIYGQADELVQTQLRLRREPVLHLCYLSVPKPGNGTGTLLVRAALERFPDRPCYVVAAPETLGDFPALLRFYARLGFEQFVPNDPHYLLRRG